MCHSQAVSPALTMGTVCFLLKPHPLEELLLLLLYGSPKGLLGVPFFIFSVAFCHLFYLNHKLGFI